MRHRLASLCFFCVLTTFSFGATGRAQPPEIKPPAVKEPSETKPTAPKNTAGDHKFESAIAAVETKAGLTQITLQSNDFRLNIKPQTELVREERGLIASNLKIGDTLCLIALKGQRSKLKITEAAVVTQLSPLTIEIGDTAKMTLLQGDQWEFYRTTPIKPETLKISQTVAVQITLKRDGDILTKRIAVLTGKPFPPKRTATKPTPKTKTATAGNN